mmetsp:Transcript_86607/g.232221  ORF Transcript_86607/g.232221 Transcript_86607/m.232221 type:complete len:238 (-) Transcript_86607:1747-2460(-)
MGRKNGAGDSRGEYCGYCTGAAGGTICGGTGRGENVAGRPDPLPTIAGGPADGLLQSGSPRARDPSGAWLAGGSITPMSLAPCASRWDLTRCANSPSLTLLCIEKAGDATGPPRSRPVSTRFGPASGANARWELEFGSKVGVESLVGPGDRVSRSSARGEPAAGEPAGDLRSPASLPTGPRCRALAGGEPLELVRGRGTEACADRIASPRSAGTLSCQSFPHLRGPSPITGDIPGSS